MDKNFLKITVDLGDKQIYERDLDDDLKVQKENINDELLEQPGKYAWWATLAELARDKVSRIKKDREVLEANLYSSVKISLEESGSKVTENGIYNTMKAMKEWQDMRDSLADAEKQFAILDVARNAFEHRKNMLMSYSANSRVDRPMNMDIFRDAVKQVIKSDQDK